MGGRNVFEPNRLPDAGDAGVEDTFWADGLFSAELGATGGVLDTDDEVVFSGDKGIGDVEAEWGVSSDMASDFGVVDPNSAAVIDGFEIEEAAAGRIPFDFKTTTEIGRAACRERVWSVV